MLEFGAHLPTELLQVTLGRRYRGMNPHYRSLKSKSVRGRFLITNKHRTSIWNDVDGFMKNIKYITPTSTNRLKASMFLYEEFQRLCESV